MSKHQTDSASLWRMSRLTRDGTAKPVSRNQILRREWREGNIIFPCPADHEQDYWQSYLVDPYYSAMLFLCLVSCHPIYSGRQTCVRTSRGHTGRTLHRISPPLFLSREGFSRPFPSSTVRSNFSVPTKSSLSTCWEKSQFV